MSIRNILLKTTLLKHSVKTLFLSASALAFLTLLTNCQQKNKIEEAIHAIPVSLKVSRFEQEFHQSDSSEIPLLKKKYPYLFPQQFHDSIWVRRQQDSLQKQLADAVSSAFPNLDSLRSEITHLFQHAQYYFRETEVPHLITLTNDVDYQTKVVYADSLLLISLDTFLGKEHPFYEGISAYIRHEMTAAHLLPEIANELATMHVPPPRQRHLLAQMIYHGKLLYLKDLLWPHANDALKIGYTEAQYRWAEENERYIWQYFIEKELLYQTHPSLHQRFMDPAPFSKFYLDIDRESPGRIGRWLGWQIVRSYSKKYPEVSLEKLLSLPAQSLFETSGYKPKR